MLQSAFKTQTSDILSPQQIKSFLQSTGSKQQAGSHPATENIGRRPDVAAAIAAAIPPLDGNQDNRPDCCEAGTGHGAGCIPASSTWSLITLGVLILITGTLLVRSGDPLTHWTTNSL